MAKVTVYTTRSCVAAKKLLTEKGVKYSEITVDSDLAMRRKLITLSGRRTVPQIWVGETHVGGGVMICIVWIYPGNLMC